MSNFLHDLEEAIGDEEVEAVTYVNARGWSAYDGEVRGPVQWEDCKHEFDYDYHTGYGGVECHPVHIWTETKVLLIGTYDGATWIESIPRHPSSVRPEYVGGG